MRKAAIIPAIILVIILTVLSVSVIIQQREIRELQAENIRVSTETDGPPIGAYQKLRHGHNISILIVGDSLGASAGAGEGHSWETRLTDWIYEKYAVRCSVKNISLGGTGSYAGYVQVMKEDGGDYDLAIICYGYNDSEESLSRYYEAIIRAVRSKYIHCNIISVLQSPEREYNAKTEVINELAEHYDIDMADTIAAFNSSGYGYDELTEDGVHPNDIGYSLYYETVRNIISDGVDAYRGIQGGDIDAVNEGMESFERFYYIPAEAGVRSADGCTVEIPFSSQLTGLPGMDYERSGEGMVEVYIDDKPAWSEEMGWSDGGSVHFISPMKKEPVTVRHSIRLEFSSEDTADGFWGLIFTDVQ